MRASLLGGLIATACMACTRASAPGDATAPDDAAAQAPSGSDAASGEAAVCRAPTLPTSLPPGGTMELLTPRRVGLGTPIEAMVNWSEEGSLDRRCSRPRSALHVRLAGGPWVDLDAADDYAPSFCGVGQWVEGRTRRVGGLVPEYALHYPDNRDQRAFAFAASILPRLQVGDNELELRFAHGCIRNGTLPLRNAVTTRVTIEVRDAQQLATYRQLVGPRVRRERGRYADRSRGFYEGTRRPKEGAELASELATKGELVAAIPIGHGPPTVLDPPRRRTEPPDDSIAHVAVIRRRCGACFVHVESLWWLGLSGQTYTMHEPQWGAAPRREQPFPCPGDPTGS